MRRLRPPFRCLVIVVLLMVVNCGAERDRRVPVAAPGRTAARATEAERLATTANAAQVSSATPLFQLVPLGKVTAAYLEIARQAIEETFVAQVRVEPNHAMPPSAYVAARGRWFADELLEELNRLRDPAARTAIGLTDEDICSNVHGVNCFGILGLGTMDGASSVISTFRLGARSGLAAFPDRLRKVTVHEIGHNFGLDHCPTFACLMQDANKKVATVDHERAFCPACQARLGAHLRSTSIFARWAN